jgi:predicted KAP-like P-loop ATPase
MARRPRVSASRRPPRRPAATLASYLTASSLRARRGLASIDDSVLQAFTLCHQALRGEYQLSGSNTTNGQEESKAISIGGDNPIHSRGADLLGRAKLANVIARHLRVIDASEGAVVGLLGPWGIGKTSLLNMIAESLGEKPPLLVVQFNPWLFSGTEQLAGHFFSEVAAQLKDQESTLSRAKGRVSAISGQLERYGQALSPLRIIPVAGPLIEKATDLAGMVSKLTQADQSINTQREELTKEMAKLESPVVVIIDDIDRLQPLEIRDIFRLVRLTANFPNLIYLLAFDRRRVESALSDDQPEGRAYLEKIIQLTFEVPPVPRVQLVRLLLDRIDKILNSEQSLGPFHEDRWPDLLHRVMVPLITNVRDVKRYVGSLPAMIKSVGDEIALEDVLVPPYGSSCVVVMRPGRAARGRSGDEAGG